MSVSPVSGGATGELIQIGARTTRSTDLSIVTAEGDKVTISASATHGVGYAAAAGSSDGASLNAAAVTVSDSRSLSISVDGDLNRRELHDIRKVVRALQQAAARGDAGRLLDRLSHAHLSSLTSVSGSITSQTVVTATKVEGTQQSAPAVDDTASSSTDTSASSGHAATPPPVAESAAEAPASPTPASSTPTTFKAPVVQKATPPPAPAEQAPRAPRIEDFMFAILKALLNPSDSATPTAAKAA
jgi:hypothetical protein